MVSQKRNTLSVPKTAHNQDWNTPRRPRTPRGEYARLMRQYRGLVAVTQSTPGTPAAMVIQ